MNKLKKDLKHYQIDTAYLQKLFYSIPDQPNHVTFEVAHQKHNRFRNRYCNVLDNSRIILDPFSVEILKCHHAISNMDEESVKATASQLNYINADKVYFTNSNKQYIATQGPLDITEFDFFKIILDSKLEVTKIITLANYIEKGAEKCFPYWDIPIGEEKNLIFFFYHNNEKITNKSDLEKMHSNLTLKKLSETKTCNGGIFIRKFELRTSEQKVYNFTQYHYTLWPDFGVPDVKSFLKLLRLNNEDNTSSGPPIVHCSAGVGRTGKSVHSSGSDFRYIEE
ncbi:hypothetical protein HDU92_008997 [Lobulomyces angularis]|nr:hypothetical protein HDU92_008997 [Lobulomyces angularis]